MLPIFHDCLNQKLMSLFSIFKRLTCACWQVSGPVSGRHVRRGLQTDVCLCERCPVLSRERRVSVWAGIHGWEMRGARLSGRHVRPQVWREVPVSRQQHTQVRHCTSASSLNAVITRLRFTDRNRGVCFLFGGFVSASEKTCISCSRNKRHPIAAELMTFRQEIWDLLHKARSTNFVMPWQCHFSG